MDEKHQHECQDGEAGFQMKIMMLVDGYQDLMRLRDAQIERLEVMKYWYTEANIIEIFE